MRSVFVLCLIAGWPAPITFWTEATSGFLAFYLPSGCNPRRNTNENKTKILITHCRTWCVIRGAVVDRDCEDVQECRDRNGGSRSRPAWQTQRFIYILTRGLGVHSHRKPRGYAGCVSKSACLGPPSHEAGLLRPSPESEGPPCTCLSLHEERSRLRRVGPLVVAASRSEDSTSAGPGID